MCGIAGFIGKKQISEKIINCTLTLMKNRGPDFQDSSCYNFKDTFVTLLHSRLNIIDLDKRSNQPFRFKDFTIVFNGEIYNYIEVREDLIKKGHKFITNSDTEVLLKAYIEYGNNCVEIFNGMWAFAIWDNKKKQLFLSRDRFSEKPFYYYEDKNGFYFGSEIKFIRSLCNQSLTINQNHLIRYLVLGYKSLYKTNATFYNNVKEIKFATNLIISHTMKKQTFNYWTPKSNINNNLTINDAVEGVKHHLLESMRIRLRADVPLAFCLSGGIDSASLVSITKNCFNYDVNTFSIIDNDERYNEIENIQATIDNTNCNSTLVKLSFENVLPRLKNLINYHDAPISTISYLVHSMLSEQIAAHGYKVAISGTGADELFTGYYDHYLLHLYAVRDNPKYHYHLENWKKYIQPLIRNPIFRDSDLYYNNPEYREHNYDNSTEFISYLKLPFEENFKEELYTENLMRNRMMNEMFHEVIPAILHEDDLNSMFYSIENRSPFLDHNLFDFAFSLPDEYLIQDGQSKYILRESMKGVLNDKVRLDRQKKGFNASINSLFDFNDPDLQEYLFDNNSPIFDIIKKENIKHLFNINPSPNYYSKFLFSFINAKIFLDTN